MEQEFSDYGEVDSKALFNDAMFQMRRISDLQANIHRLRAIPLQYNNDYGSYNYQLIFSNLCSLLFESWGKMNKTERIEADKLRKLITRLIRYNPPHKVSKDISSNKNSVNIDYELWYKIEDLLTEFEKDIKVYMDKHGLSNPTNDGAGLF